MSRRRSRACVHLGCKEQALDETGRFMSLALENKLAHDPGVLGGATLALSGAVWACEVQDH